MAILQEMRSKQVTEGSIEVTILRGVFVPVIPLTRIMAKHAERNLRTCDGGMASAEKRVQLTIAIFDCQ